MSSKFLSVYSTTFTGLLLAGSLTGCGFMANLSSPESENGTRLFIPDAEIESSSNGALVNGEEVTLDIISVATADKSMPASPDSDLTAGVPVDLTELNRTVAGERSTQ